MPQTMHKNRTSYISTCTNIYLYIYIHTDIYVVMYTYIKIYISMHIYTICGYKDMYVYK